MAREVDGNERKPPIYRFCCCCCVDCVKLNVYGRHSCVSYNKCGLWENEEQTTKRAREGTEAYTLHREHTREKNIESNSNTHFYYEHPYIHTHIIEMK